jgi:UDP-N-acetylmuramate dehydrogenase
MLVLQNVPLAPLTTLKVGGPARYFIEARSHADVLDAVEYTRSANIPLLVMGGGSNLVIADTGWPGLALKVGIRGIEESAENGKIRFEVGAGEEWDRFVARAVSRNCGGVECLSGIPGSVGGTPVQNVGAYGQEVAETIESVLVLDSKDLQLHELCCEACGFEYRTSIFNTGERGRYIILRVTYSLTPAAAPYVEYDTREAVRQIRATKAMLIKAGDEDCRSAGSFFKNPVVSSDKYQDLTTRAAAKGLRIPSYPALAEQRKVSAAWLVEHSGFSKGYGRGQVGISRKHALAIVNRGEATAAEVVALKDSIQQRVKDVWGIHLEPEPVFVGF